MTTPKPSSAGGARPRLLVMSMFFAPCKEVGGKRFSYLSRYLAEDCDELHVVARAEREALHDSTAFSGNIHRTTMLPYWPQKGGRARMLLARAWARWFCTVDKYIGWVIPATITGVRVCRQNRLDTVIVTGPQFSAVIAGVAVAMIANARLIIDYRDEWTNYRSDYPKPLGKYLCPFIERFALRRASGVVVCTDIMRTDFLAAFSDLAPAELEVIYNGFTAAETGTPATAQNGRHTMIYAGSFHGRRRLSVIAPALAQLQETGQISEETFCFNIYSRLQDIDRKVIAESGIEGLVEVHDPVSYDEILIAMRESDILFLPSGDEVPYAVPFKFFDYLSVGRPILAVASTASTVGELMRTVDCGEFVEFGDTAAIVSAITTLMRRQEPYTFAGAERFDWRNAARQYLQMIERVASVSSRSVVEPTQSREQ